MERPPPPFLWNHVKKIELKLKFVFKVYTCINYHDMSIIGTKCKNVNYVICMCIVPFLRGRSVCNTINNKNKI